MRRSSSSWRCRMSSWRMGETRTRCFCSRRRTLRWALEGALGIEAARDIMPIAATHSHAKQRTACNRCNLLHELTMPRCTAQHAASRFEALSSSALCVQMQRGAVKLHLVHHVARLHAVHGPRVECSLLPRATLDVTLRVVWYATCPVAGSLPLLRACVRAAEDVRPC